MKLMKSLKQIFSIGIMVFIPLVIISIYHSPSDAFHFGEVYQVNIDNAEIETFTGESFQELKA